MSGASYTLQKGGNAADTSWHARWLEAFELTANVTEACQATGIARKTAYNHREQFPEFKDAWLRAEAVAADKLEREAWRRAVEGWEEPVFGSLGNNSGSGEVGRIRKYDSTMLIFLLKGHKPEKFRERQEIKHEGAVPVKHIVLEDSLRPEAGDGSGS